MSGPRPLTYWQSLVLTLVANGDTDRQAAKKLGITELTMQAHMRTIRRKLHVHNRAHAVARALRTGDIKVDRIDFIIVPTELLRGHKEGPRPYPLSCPGAPGGQKSQRKGKQEKK